jgi:hypothetical protein
MSDKPMPCPFCGKSESYVTDVGDSRGFQVVCECGGMVGRQTDRNRMAE